MEVVGVGGSIGSRMSNFAICIKFEVGSALCKDCDWFSKRWAYNYIRGVRRVRWRLEQPRNITKV